jgi:HAD superfamily hydrolase (TIGR01450 family)
VTNPGALLERYSTFLIDAYGVLVTAGGCVPGAPEFLAELQRRGADYLVVTNDASRLPETSSRSYRERGIDVPPDRIITSGSLLEPYFRDNDLAGARCVVLGPPDSREYVRRAGGVPVEPDAEGEAEVVVFADESGYPFLHFVDETLSLIVRRARRGKQTHLILPNPDRVYPRDDIRLGVAVGSVASMMVHALEAALGDDAPRLVSLGKPHPPIYETALERLGTRDVVMLGDQLETDIRGALSVGIDAALVLTGVLDGATGDSDVVPTWVVDGLTAR